MLGGAVDEAYRAVRESGRVDFPTDGLSAMPQRFRQALAASRTVLNEGRTPRALEVLRDVSKTLESAQSGNVKAFNWPAIETQRQTIIDAITAAKRNSTDVDVRALNIMKREFDSQIDDMIAQGIATGDGAVIGRLKEARALHAQYMQRFEPKGAAGKLVEKLSSGEITPDQAVRDVIGTSQVAAPKAIPYIRAIKSASRDDPSVLQQLKAAHFASLLQDDAGRILEPGRVAANIQRAERNTGYLIRELYTPDEWQRTLRLADAASRLAQRSPDANPTGGGRGVRFIANWLDGTRTAALVRELPVIRPTIDMIQRAAQAADAAAAASGRMPAKVSPVVPAVTASQGSEAQRRVNGSATNPRP